MKFAGKAILGNIAPRQIGPFARTRFQREQLPGVVGYRNYLLNGAGPDTLVWQVQARYFNFTVRSCEEYIGLALSYMDGLPYIFETTSGLHVPNCTLIDWRQVTNFQQVTAGGVTGVSFELQAVIEQMSPR
jgi:hypothetical protein